ncbi:MAG: M1 family metallopeptidase [Acidobacteria bacterium]|nr:M1 family metallopeptidase [Acidobacteriota bacterium]
MTFRRLLLFLIITAATLQPADNDLGSRPHRAERSRDFDALHYRIELRFNGAERSFQGKADIRLRPLRDGFKTVVLDAETFRVTSAGSLRFEQKPGQLTIHLGRPCRYHE